MSQPKGQGNRPGKARPPVRTSAKSGRPSTGTGTATGESAPEGSQLSVDSDASVEEQTGPATQAMATPGIDQDTSERPVAPGINSPAGPAAGAGTPVGAAASAAPQPQQVARPSTGARRVRLSISRVDPWSVMKLGFLLSVALGIITVVATAVVWNVLDQMGTFGSLRSMLEEFGALDQFQVILDFLELRNVMSMSIIISIVNVALITALTTLGAFIYNVVAALVGGLHMTLTDD